MSVEVINLFTSSDNISYIKNKLNTLITDNLIKESIFDSLIETIFSFQDYNIIENSKSQLRHSTNIQKELDKLNYEFINDRLAFVKNFHLYSKSEESYADQMFINDSLKPKGYIHFNDHINNNKDDKMYEYNDKPSKSNFQSTKRDNIDYDNIDELRNSEVSQVRKIYGYKSTDTINTIPLDIKKPEWIDI
jgi:hypothetical protein